jgi:type IV secretion system protein TrbL
MKWNGGSLLFLATMIVALSATVSDAQGPVGPPGPIAPSFGFIAEYEQLRKLWFFQMFPAMQDLFWKLAFLELVVSLVMWGTHSYHVDTLSQQLFRKLLFIFVGYTMLLNADVWMPTIINSFVAVGKAITGIDLTPDFVFFQGAQLAATLLQRVGLLALFSHPIGVAVALFAALLVVVSFGFIAIELAVTLVESYIVMGAGAFLLAFLPFRGTSVISERYLSVVIAVGIKLFMIYILVAAGTQLAPGWGSFISSKADLTYVDLFALGFAAVLFLMLAMRIPHLAASVTTGVSSLGMGDVLAASGTAIRAATIIGAGAAGAVGGTSAVSGAVSIGQARAAAAGGGIRGAISGFAAGAGALSREALAAAVPRLHQSSTRLQQQAKEARAQRNIGPPENYIQ